SPASSPASLPSSCPASFPASSPGSQASSSLLTARHGLAAAVSGNVLYLIGGGKHPGLSVSDNVETLEVR
ncbi:MAG: hypothetical protein LC775_04585, partial [Acidobacteria bacterium]|nr:hypothetical protein [Acidobacteriota bacterium]